MNRLKFLQIAVCTGLLGGIFFSFELWFSLTRSFPRVPVFFELPIPADRIFTAVLIVSLISTLLFQRLKVFPLAAIVSLILLAIFDQMRLQPWIYQYFLLIAVIALADEDSDQTLRLAQILIAALYFWSGVQKLNFTFSHETLPLLMAPLQNLFPSVQLPMFFIGTGIALIESVIGGGLLFRRTRKIAVCAAVVMHAVILGLLIAKNYNSIVWIWNAALIFMVVIAFWQSEISLRQTIITVGGWKKSVAKSIVAAGVLLPVLSFFGLWDLYLSGALYSGNTAVGVVRISEDLYEKLPPKAKQSVFQTKTGGEKILPLVEWSIAEMNVPAVPAQRVFDRIAGDVCKMTADKDNLELIIRERPAILDGSYILTRKTCEQLQK